MPQQQRVALARVLRILRRQFRTTTEMAEAWGINQPQLSQLMQGKDAGAGVSVLSRIREKSGVAIDTLLGYDLTVDHLMRARELAQEDLTADEQAGFAEALKNLEATEPLVPLPGPISKPKPKSRPRPKPGPSA